MPPCWLSRETAPMIRLLFAIPLCALASSQATARNDPSEILLALSEDERNAAFTHLLQESNEKTELSAHCLMALCMGWITGRLSYGSTWSSKLTRTCARTDD
jgi:hypothetical protein